MANCTASVRRAHATSSGVDGSVNATSCSNRSAGLIEHCHDFLPASPEVSVAECRSVSGRRRFRIPSGRRRVGGSIRTPGRRPGGFGRGHLLADLGRGSIHRHMSPRPDWNATSASQPSGDWGAADRGHPEALLRRAIELEPGKQPAKPGQRDGVGQQRGSRDSSGQRDSPGRVVDRQRRDDQRSVAVGPQSIGQRQLIAQDRDRGSAGFPSRLAKRSSTGLSARPAANAA